MNKCFLEKVKILITLRKKEKHWLALFSILTHLLQWWDWEGAMGAHTFPLFSNHKILFLSCFFYQLNHGGVEFMVLMTFISIVFCSLFILYSQLRNLHKKHPLNVASFARVCNIQIINSHYLRDHLRLHLPRFRQ